jgi:hypothetical protein
MGLHVLYGLRARFVGSRSWPICKAVRAARAAQVTRSALPGLRYRFSVLNEFLDRFHQADRVAGLSTHQEFLTFSAPRTGHQSPLLPLFRR